MGWASKDWDCLLVPAGFAALGMYHMYFVHVLRKQPLRTVIGMNHAGRRARSFDRTFFSSQDTDKKGVLAVQSLRNSMMGSILWATTAVLLCAASVAFVNTSYDQMKPTNSTDRPLESYIVGAHDRAVLSAKVTCLLLCFMVCFFCCMQAVRFLGQVSFLINTPVEFEAGVLAGLLTPDYVAKLFEKACNFQAMGTRIFYVAVPLLLWIVGPVLVFMACLAMIPFLYQLDMLK